MRRVVSVILFVIGGWILTSEVMMAAIDMHLGNAAAMWVIIGIFMVFAAPFLLLGTWASPGNRFADLGMTIMIAAGAGAAVAVMTVVMMHDPGTAKLMPPGQKLPQFDLAPVNGLLNLIVVAGVGFLLWWFGRARQKRTEPNLERVFGDD